MTPGHGAPDHETAKIQTSRTNHDNGRSDQRGGQLFDDSRLRAPERPRDETAAIDLLSLRLASDPRDYQVPNPYDAPNEKVIVGVR